MRERQQERQGITARQSKLGALAEELAKQLQEVQAATSNFTLHRAHGELGLRRTGPEDRQQRGYTQANLPSFRRRYGRRTRPTPRR